MDEGRYLKDLATHFAFRDWRYTRQHDIVHIRYKGDYKGYDHPLQRVKRVLFPSRSSRRLARLLLPVERWNWREPVKSTQLLWWTLRAHLTVGLRTGKNLPDGVLDGGGVITHWEETGEYLQMVQPSVGSLLADFLLAEPEHPHAVLILAELKRIGDDYERRIKADQVHRSGKRK